MSQRKPILIGAMGVLMIAFVATIALGAELVVPDDYATIQEAVDNASSGDTVTVKAGEYAENVVVSTPGISLILEDGAVISGSNDPGASELATLTIEANDVTVTGGTITGPHDGIRVINASDVTIDNVNVTNNGGDGIEIGNATSNVTVRNSRISNNNGFGVRVGSGATGVLIEGNTISGNTEGGVHPQ